MNRKKKLLAAGLAVLGAALAVCWKFRRQPASAEESLPVADDRPEDAFLREWTAVLSDNARVFNGLFGGLYRVQNGDAPKPEKVLREWCQRTHYRWEGEPVDLLCREQILPLIETADARGLGKWAGLLLEAAAAAGITREEAAVLVLTEDNADAYLEWDGDALYPEDAVEVITPAWYRNGKTLEQGLCRKTGSSAD